MASQRVITLDGPAASGKSSVARRVAEVLGIPYVSSGLFYRAATYLVTENNQDASDEAAVMALLARHEVNLEPAMNRVLIDGEDISAALHTDEVDRLVSVVARHPRVRLWVKERLRLLKGTFVIEGRDMGSVVFPEARHKFYLTALPEVRAERRAKERGGDLQEVTEALKRRDLLDRKQLEPADDAICLDTTGLSIEEVTNRVLACVQEDG